MTDLTKKTLCRIHARLEGVYLLDRDIPHTIRAKEFYSEDELCALLEVRPMLVVFKDNKQKLGLRHVMHPVTSYLTDTLRTLLTECKHLGGYRNSWTSFQLELALEEIFFGKTMSYSSKQFSVSLGTNSTHVDSLTKQRGFIGLAPVGSASVGDSPPPITTWIHDPVQQLRIERIFPFTESLQAGPSVVGDSLVLVLLGDMYEKNEELPLQTLKTTLPAGGKLLCARSVADFSKELAEKKAFRYPHTFGRAIEMAQSEGHDVQHCLQLALSSFSYFPHLVYWDEKRNTVAKWNKKNFIQLLKPTDMPSIETQALAMTGDVAANLQKLDLTYARNLIKYKTDGMPWMEMCLRKLPRNLTKQQKTTTLTFISAIALIHNNDYVSFSEIGKLIPTLPVTQLQLQQLQILSPLILIHSPVIHRLHDSVPYKVQQRPALQKRPAPPPGTQQHSKPVITEPEEQEEQQVIDRVQTNTMPANTKGRWSEDEVDWIMAGIKLTARNAYKEYLKKCKEFVRPARTFAAFRRKRERMIEAFGPAD
ncbi:uncharacterized protein LOC125140694 [Tachysurus fulvidraco]|uniref:uncharacterized protein LOC125140694 n=1 Tax=Tachysurus fulvidraco TaxID=1234273 RepID=UPI001FF0510F|nr:uncharacterized protein LOC125140694 [Tachysurus fulvidraco]